MTTRAGKIAILHALPLDAGGVVEESLGWVADLARSLGFGVAVSPTVHGAPLRAALEDATAVVVGDLRPGSDVAVAGALAQSGVPVVLFHHGYGFCAPGSRSCTGCPLQLTCAGSDRVAVYRRLEEAAELVVYLSPLHRQVSETFVGRRPDRTVVSPPPRLAPVGGDPGEAEGAVAFPGRNDPGEWANLLRFAEEHPREQVRLYGDPPGQAGAGPDVPRNVTLLRSVPWRVRRELLGRASKLLLLPERPLPFGADAAAMLLAGREVVTHASVGLRSYGWRLDDRPSLEAHLAAGRDELRAAFEGALTRRAPPRAASRPRPARAAPAPFERPLLWCHGLGLGDSINLLPFARSLAAAAGAGALTWVMPQRHLALLGGEAEGRLVADEDFEISAARREHDLVFEISVYDHRLSDVDVLDERWIRLVLCRSPSAYETIHENLLSLLARAGVAAVAGRPTLSLRPDELRRGAAVLRAAGLDPDADLILLVHPGAGGRVKCWPAARFGELCVRARAELSARIVMVGGPAEDDLVDRALAVEPRCHPVLRGMPLRELAAVVAHATAWVGNDSGLTHLACACETPVLAVFPCSDPGVWGPTHPLSQVVVPAAHERDGRGRGDPTVDAVMAGLARLLRRVAGEPPRRPDQRVRRLTGPGPRRRGGALEWLTRHARIAVPAAAEPELRALLAASGDATPWERLGGRISQELLAFAMATGLLGPSWLDARTASALAPEDEAPPSEGRA